MGPTPIVMVHWEPVGWFVPTIGLITLLAIVLALRGWRAGGPITGVILPWLLGTAVLAIAFMQWHLADQELLLRYAWYGQIPPPYARFYLLTGAMGGLPLLACFARPWARKRLVRA